MSEFELDLVKWLRGHQADRVSPKVISSPAGTGKAGLLTGEASLLVGEASLLVGDDMALVETEDGSVLMSSDMLLDSVHFDSKNQSPSEIGRKAVACCLSDCAAMAVRPVAITVSLAVPESQSLDETKELMEGMWSMADEFETQIVGGDTTRWKHPLAIDVAILAGPYKGVEPVTRSGAKPGDALFVTGSLGGSRLGKHLAFTPRVCEARMLVEHLGTRLHAMIDISDGLSLDLWRICEASGVGATLSQTELESVISVDARQAAGMDGRSPLDHALSDGEDFELLIAVEGERPDDPFPSGLAAPGALPVHRIGEVTDGDLLLKDAEGRCETLDPKGYIH